MRARFADWLNRRLIEQRGEYLAPPGGSQGFRMLEPNGSEFTVLARGDVFECYYGKRAIYSFSVSPFVMLRLAWFILWVWWIRGTWCGVKSRLWQWSLEARRELKDG